MARQDELIFNIEMDEVFNIQKMLNANNKQVRLAMQRALRRTANTLKARSVKYLKDSLQAKNSKKLRQRFRHIVFKKDKNEFGEYKFWFGLNDVPISALKGSVKKLGTRRNRLGGQFSPKSSLLHAQKYHEKAFVARVNGKRSVFIRRGKKRFPVDEGKVPIAEEISDHIDDEIFWDMNEIFMHHFEVDLKGRVKMGSKIKNTRGKRR